ncbi:hypothetical protein P691DRAFT_791374 [Macrolepiota fuliginosa MF-IS2]|uniref:G domain-containing protein n=1 Tax=Macrolepiota fuliginosa MF-IS2 TaxID=1400762 RepID=A0A9P5X150_9AGAR|nr:hypothetical protein P691DRAFT_791374 [Macrolepiota fuliginosa MF-IS2]
MAEPTGGSCDAPGQHTPHADQSLSAIHQDISESLVASDHRDDTPNIILFGETGVGKSSVVNMLSEKDVAVVSNDVTGCTFGSVDYGININGGEYVLWDTAGLNEDEAGSVPGDQALRNLRDLVWKLKEGVSLLVYCIRGTRYRDILKVNYDLFTDIICQGKVPVVVVVTGLENEERMDDWWKDNEAGLSNHGVNFKDHACVTTTRGKKSKDGMYLFQREYDSSKDAVKRLISTNCLQPPIWIANSDLQWIERISERIERYYDAYNSRSPQERGTGPNLHPIVYLIMVALRLWARIRSTWTRAKDSVHQWDPTGWLSNDTSEDIYTTFSAKS